MIKKTCPVAARPPVDANTLDRVVAVILTLGSLLMIGREPLRSLNEPVRKVSELSAMSLEIGEVLPITPDLDGSSLLGFYAPEEHGVWLGHAPGYLRLRARDSLNFGSVRLLFLAANTGRDKARTITATVGRHETTLELPSGELDWLVLEGLSASEVDIEIRCSPALASGGDDVRPLCALLSTVEIIR